ncbi:sensor histidine kinase [Maricaulis sp.]|uniref:sensor histidine kinase n=1 Tax=Maricaulis sp. TaxID=1486257 RepID=UPI002B271654|nr:ATP-binding protein [Maricaulis sp.]
MPHSPLPGPPDRVQQAEYETLTGLLHAYRSPVVIILFGILVSLVLFFATLVGQSRDKARDFRGYALARIVELDGAIARLDVELNQLVQAAHIGLAPTAALDIFRSDETRRETEVIRDMGIVEAGRLTASLNSGIGMLALPDINTMLARRQTGTDTIVLPLLDDSGRHTRFALVRRLDGHTDAWAYVVSEFDVMLASPVGPVDPLWVVVRIADRAPASVLADASEFRRISPGDVDMGSALQSAPFMVRWAAADPFSDIAATLLPRRSFLMRTGPLPWVVLASALFATITIGAISLKDARRADEVRREVARKTEALRRSNAIIAAKNAELDRFASHASHDLQAPLRAMKGISSLLVERKLDLDERSRDMLERINRGADRAQRLVQDLLSYTRADRQEARIELIDPDALVSEIEELLAAVITESEAKLEWSLDTPIHADPFLLGRMLQNLISNAIKYRRDEPPRVRIDARLIANHVRLRVTDNGIGIEAEHFQRIFQVFERLHGRDTYEGTGIGLALCQRAVELHGGDISVTSTPGEGSCFTVRLPSSLANRAVSAQGGDEMDQAVSNDR